MIFVKLLQRKIFVLTSGTAHPTTYHEYGSVIKSKKKQTKAYEKQLTPADWIGSVREELACVRRIDSISSVITI